MHFESRTKQVCSLAILSVQDYTLTLYLHQYWRDDRLAFSEDDSIELTLSGDFAERIWVPDTL